MQVYSALQIAQLVERGIVVGSVYVMVRWKGTRSWNVYV